MTKIFLFMESASELAGFETLLRKLGFDTVSTTREAQVSERMLGFFADLVILPGRGGHIDGLRLAAKVRNSGYQRSLALTWPREEPHPDSDFSRVGVDGLLAYPIEPEDALASIAELIGQDPGALLGKFEKFHARAAPPDRVLVTRGSGVDLQERVHVRGGALDKAATATVTGGAGDRPADGGRGAAIANRSASELEMDRRQRNARFLDLLADVDVSAVLPKGIMARSAEELRKSSEEEASELEKLLESKRAFVRMLFGAARDARRKSG